MTTAATPEVHDRTGLDSPPPNPTASWWRRGWLWLVVGVVTGVAATALGSALVGGESDSASLTGRWVTALEHKDLDGMVALYDENATWDDQAMNDHFEGTSGVRFGWGIFSMAGFKVSDVKVVATDSDSSVVRWTIGGARNFVGQPWNITGVSVLEFSGNEIVAETVYYDQAPLR